MSYRNDHDAALARIDALEAELGKSADARAKFTSLEAQLAQAKHALEMQQPRASRALPATLAVTAMLVFGGIGLALKSASKPTHDVSPVPPAAAAIEPHHLATHTQELLTCVAALDAAVAAHRTIGPSCVATLADQITDVGLGPDIHQVLVAWHDAEQRGEIGDRDALVGEIHRFVIPSYTR